MRYSGKIFKPSQFSTLLLVWTGGRTVQACSAQASLFTGLLARQPACLGFPIERLRHAGRSALLRKRKDFQLQPLLATGQAHAIAHVQRLGRFAAGAVHVDLAAFDGLLGQAAGFIHARSPKPDIGAYFGQWFMGYVFHRGIIGKSPGDARHGNAVTLVQGWRTN